MSHHPSDYGCSVYRRGDAAGATWALRHLPDGRGGAAAAGVRRHCCVDQRPARTAFHSSVRMTAHRARSARPNGGDETGAIGQRLGQPDQSAWPRYATGERHSPRAANKNAWRTAFSGHNLTEGTPNGECRSQVASYPCPAVRGGEPIVDTPAHLLRFLRI